MGNENIYIMAYYSAVKNNDILKFACKCMELEKKNILSEIAQIQKNEQVMYSLITGY